MEKLKEFTKTHQLKIVLVLGYLLVSALGFGLGRLSVFKHSAPEVQVQESFQAPSNYTPVASGIQTTSSPATPASAGDCAGKIKGSSSLIYHLPGDAFYTKTTHPIRCFDTEAEAKAAGFRKSAR
jgi:hypothetical protein